MVAEAAAQRVGRRRLLVPERPRLTDPVLLASLAVPPLLVATVGGPYSYMGLLLPLAVAAWRLLLPLARQSRGMDIELLFLLAHMYAVSTGRPPRRRLFELNTVIGGYGVYQAVLRRIAVLAVEWGYGFVRAVRIYAARVANDAFRGFLIRMSEVLRTGDDVVRFLRVELGTAIRQFNSSYLRSIDMLRMFLGLYATLLSASVFVILTFTILTLFVGGDTRFFITSIAILTAIISVFAILAGMIVPEDRIVYHPPGGHPRLRRLRAATLAAFAASVTAGPLVYLETRDPMYTILAFALPAVAPGLVALRIEGYVKRLNQFYQVFVRSFGLTYSVIPNYAKALASILAADYGELTPYIRRLHARITNGVDPHLAFRLFAEETLSMDVVRGTNIIVDSIDAGGDPSEVGIMLNDLLIRLNDLRIDRDRVTRTFEAVVYMMQGLVAAISSAVINILVLFSEYYRRLSDIANVAPQAAAYLPFHITIPDMGLVSWAMALFLTALIVVNSVVIARVRSSLFEISLLHTALLTIVTVTGVKAMELAARSLIAPLMLPAPTP